MVAFFFETPRAGTSLRVSTQAIRCDWSIREYSCPACKTLFFFQRRNELRLPVLGGVLLGFRTCFSFIFCQPSVEQRARNENKIGWQRKKTSLKVSTPTPHVDWLIWGDPRPACKTLFYFQRRNELRLPVLGGVLLGFRTCFSLIFFPTKCRAKSEERKQDRLAKKKNKRVLTFQHQHHTRPT